MSNGKKSKTKSKTKQCPTSDHVSAAPVQISADELQHLIAKAIVEARISELNARRPEKPRS